MSSELERTLAAKEAFTFRLGPYSRPGRIVFNASSAGPSNLYVSSFVVGNVNRIGGAPGVGAPIEVLDYMTSFPAGLPVTIRVHNEGDAEVRLSLAVLAA